ncbi:BatD family protein [Winogradskyella bathintestinalis]|uniref:BatD family protein n=1 Tax=Winogradskyella bathintestinalis TaxID=3035208 RepID=A0ABT7ZRE2_9FLAO|nr:BatD family protein [Winogradskyella bathintestinalis]MDN3491379.1 BatD family protein [Winogradskyella bathintestinalis]
MNSIIKPITILFLILATSIASAQVKFEAKVSKKKLGVNERLRIDFEMNQDGDNFVPPSFADFDVVGGPNTSVSNYSRNGKRSYNKTYSYFLAPKKRGNFTIKQATIEIDDETYKTFPISINVTAAVSKPNGNTAASDIASENIHLVAEVSNGSPFLNEAITVVYKLYVSTETGVSNWREKDIPRYNDFWSQNIDIKGLNVQEGEYKGEKYRYVVLRKTVLYPQKTGALKLEPLVLDITVEVPSNRRDIFGRPLMSKVPQVVTAGSRTINVKPLPEKEKPSDFKGAVGDFTFNVTTSKTQLNATESLQAKIEVKGKGNLKLFEVPKLTVPSSLEVYEPEHQENVRTNLNGMQGSIADTYTIVPQYRGKYPVPSISFSYFDPVSESYKRLSSDEIIIDVLEGPMAATNTPENTTSNTKQSVDPNTNTFAFIKTTSNWTPIKSEPFFKSKAFWSLVLLPFLAIPLAIVVRRKKDERDADVQGNRIRRADRLAKKYLSEAKKAMGQKEAFYLALEKALHNYLKAKLNIETSDFNKEKIENLLKERKVDSDVVTDFISILENCELARYTPITQVTMQNDYDKAARTISLIDKQLR